jgi:hypothetical protein
MKTTIRTILTGEAQDLALGFITHLLSRGVEFERGGGYWADKNYYIARYNGEAVCSIVINNDETIDEPVGWVIWSDDSGVNSFESYPLDDHVREDAWANVDLPKVCCTTPSCKSCKIIFGKAFDGVCNTTFRFDNPNTEEVECAKKLAEIRIEDIVTKMKGIST